MEAYEGDGILPTWKGARGTVQPGGCPVGYSPYAQSDCHEILGTITCEVGFLGHIGNFVIFEEQDDEP